MRHWVLEALPFWQNVTVASFFALLMHIPLASVKAQPVPDSGSFVPNQVQEQAPSPIRYRALKLRGVEKITAKSEAIEAPMGIVTRFGNLEIIPRACWESPPEVTQKEQAGLMEVWYWKQGEQPSMVFSGWMFASSPSLSSLAHPVYDLTMLECVPETADAANLAEKLAP